MIKFIKRVFQNSVISYIFFGGCTTFVNLAIYYVLRQTISLGINPANIISITCAILFAYFTNSRYVFRSEADTLKQRLFEFVKFFSGRLTTMAIEIVGVNVFVLAGIDDRISKLLTQFVVLVLNYIISKSLVFRKNSVKRL